MRRKPRFENHLVRLAGTVPSNGAFMIKHNGIDLRMIVSDGFGWEEDGLPGPPWEHVSVSVNGRVPTWEEMCFVKDIWWEPNETVIQFHPRRDRYIDCNPHVLHLWRCPAKEPAMPPLECV